MATVTNSELNCLSISNEKSEDTKEKLSSTNVRSIGINTNLNHSCPNCSNTNYSSPLLNLPLYSFTNFGIPFINNNDRFNSIPSDVCCKCNNARYDNNDTRNGVNCCDRSNYNGFATNYSCSTGFISANLIGPQLLPIYIPVPHLCRNIHTSETQTIVNTSQPGTSSTQLPAVPLDRGDDKVNRTSSTNIFKEKSNNSVLQSTDYRTELLMDEQIIQLKDKKMIIDTDRILLMNKMSGDCEGYNQKYKSTMPEKGSSNHRFEEIQEKMAADDLDKRVKMPSENSSCSMGYENLLKASANLLQKKGNEYPESIISADNTDYDGLHDDDDQSIEQFSSEDRYVEPKIDIIPDENREKTNRNMTKPPMNPMMMGPPPGVPKEGAALLLASLLSRGRTPVDPSNTNAPEERSNLSALFDHLATSRPLSANGMQQTHHVHRVPVPEPQGPVKMFRRKKVED